MISGAHPTSLGMSGMMLQNRIVFNIAPWTIGLYFLQWIFERTMSIPARDPDPKVFENLLMNQIATAPGPDAETYRDDRIRGLWIEATREAVKAGGPGSAWEEKLLSTPWGFDLEEIDNGLPLTLWHGDLDVNCPLRMAREAAESMPGTVLRVSTGEGHVSWAWRNQETILKELVRI